MVRFSQIQIPDELPIAERESSIVEALRSHQVVIVKGETGSGKTTQLPKICLKHFGTRKGIIGCTQPRRVAAIAVANRIEEELNQLGQRLVGSKIRFTDKTTRDTRIKIMTDGILLNEMQTDPLLRKYETIIVDEAHERSLNIDFILGHLAQILENRPELKVIVTSATIDTDKFSKAFGGAPVIEVSGRMYPVEVRYQPLDTMDEDSVFTYIDGCFEAVNTILSESRSGDVLVFLPTEKDIRELCDRLEDERGGYCEAVPLFGRLSQSDQHRIFAPSSRRKIVVATNIAETSITVPGIRYVVDSGLARVSRFSAHTRTQRLPIEAVSQSSANQRKGRCGRVSEGICIRLYSEEDFLDRSEFTAPEILRSNLASVILRLKAFKFGSIETFPFLDAPDKKALDGGMILLKELSAIDADGELTEIGQRLARLPIDPTIGRMLLEAAKFNVVKSVLIIASVLSIQDPRERPMDKAQLADAEHQKFRIKGSDFLTLRKIWDEYDENYEKWTQGKMRKFCRNHFISYQRLREWRDTFDQIRSILSDLGDFRFNEEEAHPDLIHRSILSGLVGNVAFKEDGNLYQATRGRKVTIFPGSVLSQKSSDKAKSQTKPSRLEKEKKEWIMAVEFVETSRLFARTVAKVDPQWIIEATKHLVNYSYIEPHWSSKAQRVLIWRRSLLYGLIVERRRVGYGSVEPRKAKEIFIQAGLLERDIQDHFDFLKHNQALEDRIQELQARTRKSLVYDMSYKLYQLYANRLPEIASVAELHKWWRKTSEKNRQSLFFTEKDLADNEEDASVDVLYPKAVDIGGERRVINYQYQPGHDGDGATLSLPIGEYAGIEEGSLDWLVPGYISEKVELLLRALPKEYRTQLNPIKDAVSSIMLELKPSPKSLISELSKCVRDIFAIEVPERLWNLNVLPEHLKLKVELVESKSGNTVGTARDWDELHHIVKKHLNTQRTQPDTRQQQMKVWQDACLKWERVSLKRWSFGDLPREIDLGTFQGIQVSAYPGIVCDTSGDIAVRLFKRESEANLYTPWGYRKLAESCLGREYGWFIKDLKKLKKCFIAFADCYTWDAFEADLIELVMSSLLRGPKKWPLTKEDFDHLTAETSKRLRGMAYELEDVLSVIGDHRLEMINGKNSKHPLVMRSVSRWFPKRFFRIYSLDTITRLDRYVKALNLRIQRLASNPRKDAEKAALLVPINQVYKELMGLSVEKTQKKEFLSELNAFFFLFEEYRVSLFAQELGTSIKVSEKILLDEAGRLKQRFGQH
jgi:ATP-dependent helicase HrpA